MRSLLALPRKEVGRKTKLLRQTGKIPAVVYGPKIKGALLSVDKKQFAGVYREVGESSLLNLQGDGEERLVLVRDIQRDPLTSDVIHIDFYQPALDEKIVVTVPLVFEGEAPIVRESGGTLIRNIQEVEVRAFPQDLPHEIHVHVSKLASFEDNILVKDLLPGGNGEILRGPDEVVAHAIPAEAIEEELAKPIEEGVEKVEQVKEEEKEEEAESVPQEGGAPKA